MRVEKKKIIVAMSGGVDSSYVAALMAEKGFDVTGVTLKMYEGQDAPLEDAEKVAKHLGIKWRWADYSSEFSRDIMSYFIKTYKQGLTPNPCCYCNRHGKFNYLYSEMMSAGAERIAAGHYASVKRYRGHNFISKALDETKDQSYYMCLLAERQIDILDLPLGTMLKEDVRREALSLGIPVAEKKDSQEICFLEDEDYRDYLRRKIPASDIKKGRFILNGKDMGEHDGILFYTIGQRRGLGIGYKEPLYVKHIDAETGNITLGVKNEIYNRGVRLEGCSFITLRKRIFRAHAKLRYRMKAESCLVEIQPEGRTTILFDEPQSAAAPGQVACIYDKDRVVGGGFITESF